MNGPRIVAGYDGSAESGAAVGWAVEEAARTGSPLCIVHAYQPPRAADLADAATRAQERLDELVAYLRVRNPAAEISAVTVRADAARALLDAAATAELLVVGSRGTSGVTGLLLGSVGQEVAAHAPVPVAVIRAGGGADDGPVVVGVDGSSWTEAALGLAFEQAASRGAELVAIRAYPPHRRPCSRSAWSRRPSARLCRRR